MLRRTLKYIVPPLVAIIAMIGLSFPSSATNASVQANAKTFATNHYTDFDWATWWLLRWGSWWVVESDWCFTGAVEDTGYIKISNAGSQAHDFYWSYENYYGNVYAEAFTHTTIQAGQSHTFYIAAGGSYIPPVSQVNHPRVKIYWTTSNGSDALLNDHTPWINPSSNHTAGMTYDHYVNQCDSWSMSP